MHLFASPSVDKVVTVRESLETCVDFLIACLQHGLSRLMLNRVAQCVALGKWMRSPKCFSSCSMRFRNVYFISVAVPKLAPPEPPNRGGAAQKGGPVNSQYVVLFN